MQPVLLTDIDNTLYDWTAFFAPGFRAMIHALSRELEIAKDTLYAECKKVFAQYQSLEYPFYIQELESVKSAGVERRKHLIRSGRGAFNAVRKKWLQPYPGVVDTLKWLNRQGVLVVAVTNAPVYLSQQRLWDLKLDAWIEGLVGWEGWEASGHDPVNQGFVGGGRIRRKTRVRNVVTVPVEECKPGERHYSRAPEAFHARRSDAWAIGDSLAGDLEPAARLGIRTVWARYGATPYDPTEKNMAARLRITPWNASRVRTTYGKNAFCADSVIDTFEALQRIIPERCPGLF